MILRILTGGIETIAHDNKGASLIIVFDIFGMSLPIYWHLPNRFINIVPIE